MRFMTKENTLRIGGLFPKVLQCELATRTNIVELKYIRMQVEMDVQKPILSGFRHVIGNKGCWIQCRDERLAEFCYKCGMIGHAKNQCKLNIVHNQIADGDMYGPWVRAKADAYTVVSEGSYLRRMEILRGEIFYSFSNEINTDCKDGDSSGREADITESVEEDNRAKWVELKENRVNSADTVNVVETIEEVGDNAGMEKAESHQSDQILGMNNKFQNSIFAKENVGSLGSY